MRKIIIATILFTSCQVQDNKSVHIPVNKATIVPAKLNKTTKAPAAAHSQECNIANGENNKQSEISGNKPAQVEDPASTIITTDSKGECTESNGAPNIDAKAETKDNDGGASNYEEGYIPFIKQYW